MKSRTRVTNRTEKKLINNRKLGIKSRCLKNNIKFTQQSRCRTGDVYLSTKYFKVRTDNWKAVLIYYVLYLKSLIN